MATYPELNGKTVLVTGGANGIGAATVRAFAEQGAHVCFCDVDARAGKTLAAEVGQANAFARVDLRKEHEVAGWIERIGKQSGDIHVLVNNAARDPRMTLESMSARDWDDLFSVNLRAFFFTCRHAVPRMPKDTAVINLASITVHIGPADMSAYVATKMGILGFTRSLARELGPRRIRVNAVSPGWTMTERQLRQYVTPAAKRLIRRSQCVPDLVQPEEIAEVILFLASDASRAITGQEILVDRGWAHS